MKHVLIFILLIAVALPSGGDMVAQKKQKPAQPPTPPPVIRDRKGNPIEPEVVAIPAGTFLMGSEDHESDERPAHEVTVSAFWIGKYEISNRQYKAFIEMTGLKPPKWWEDGNFPEQISDHPVTGISWEDAYAYCDWLSEFTKNKYRLPTEAEWERAARGGLTGMKYPWGNDINKLRANFGKNFAAGTTPAGKLKPNDFGVCDMAGNVAEWVSDWYADDFYSKSGKENPKGPETGNKKVVRGGSWNDDPEEIRVSIRKYEGPTSVSETIGFRIVREK